MRDPILDKVFQPVINRLGANPRLIAFEFAHAFCALHIVAQSRSAYISLDVAVCAVTIALSAALMQGLRLCARQGASILSSHFGFFHLMLRVALLGFGLYGLVSPLFAHLAQEPATGDAVVRLGTSLATVMAGISLYIGVCDQPPAKRRPNFATA